MTTTIPAETWQVLLDEVAGDLLAEAGVVAPPVDALGIARRLRIDVAFDSTQHSRARFKRLAGGPAIFLRPDDRPERLQWAAAHELGELIAWRVFDRLAESEEDGLGLREPVANLLASRILLPGGWFYDDAERTSGDLLRLKARYWTASHELIAWRLLDLPQPAIITVFDHGLPQRRRSNGYGRAPRLQPIEKTCREEAHRLNQPVELRDDRLIVQTWPVHEPGWKREILRTRSVDE